MSDVAEVGTTRSEKWLLILLLLFIGSGCAALIYEVVWFQLLQLSIGSSAISLGVLLGVYMGGMCLGSLMAPRILRRRHHPLKVYALLEAGIGVFGVIHALQHILFDGFAIKIIYSTDAAHE